MASERTLNSRLRVLVAKTFRAEKLYGAIRNKNDSLITAATLSEIANDIRAQEWQRSHFRLRSALNDALSLPNSQLVAEEVEKLQNHFASITRESTGIVEKGSAALIEDTQRQEAPPFGGPASQLPQRARPLALRKSVR